jgi:hypothetical protein
MPLCAGICTHRVVAAEDALLPVTNTGRVNKCRLAATLDAVRPAPSISSRAFQYGTLHVIEENRPSHRILESASTPFRRSSGQSKLIAQ